MFLVLIAVIAASFMALLGDVASKNYATRDQENTKVLEANLGLLGAGIEQFYLRNNAYPSSLSALAATPGFNHLKDFAAQSSVYGYRVATNISDGTNTFSRAAVFNLNSKIGETSADFTAGTNTCGTGVFDSAASWCGPRAAPWLRYESRTVFIDQKGLHYANVVRTYQKISQMYWPSRIPTYPAMTPSTRAIADLVGYAGTAAACSGNFRLWGGVELDCTDLFSPWGTLVYIVRNSGTDIQLGASAP